MVPTLTVSPADRVLLNETHRQRDYFSDQSLLHQLLEAVPDIVLILNEQGQIIFANHALLDFLGLRREDLVAEMLPGEALNCIYASESVGRCGRTEFCLACGTMKALLSSVRGVESVQECRITRQDGSALDVQVRIRPLKMENERLTVFAVKDISGEKRRRALEHTFFHDVLNTAGLLRGYTELLNSAKPEDTSWLRERISHLSERLVEEIRAQRSLTEAENNELVVQPQMLDSQAILQEVVRFFEWYAANREVYLVIAAEAQSVAFSSDGTLLKRVIGNMVKNALEASQPGDIVTLTCTAAGDHVVFSVHNPAVMPKNVQLQIFQRSFSTKGNGRGLGTYSMKLLTEQYLHGQVWFTSTPDGGTTFYARYPVAWAVMRGEK